ncbi:MAG: hypothetical protein AUH30_01480 [Candidatus Rokubacteria bacterium 13_1_40CM_68_15]|nr:MAG: hypothetical protein AUH30_01480 [Candidatus Rokubacteria bacterium 13_1_40CM_68_15]
MHPCIRALILIGAGLLALPASTGFAQTSAPASEIDQLKQELRRMQERLQKLEQAPPAPAPAAASTPLIPVAAQVPPMAPRPGEREILLDREHPLEVLGLSKPELGGVRFSGFFVGSANYNSRIQMVPEFAGSTPVSSEPNRTDFRFDQFTFGAYKTFAPWLWAGASLEVENHAHRHSHGFDPDFGCPSMDRCVEQFGTEAGTTEISLHRMNITGVAPLGNGLAISFGRFDTPYGYERHDAALNLTATTSELQRFGRPQSYTGFQAAYAFAPWLDVVGWVANQWESETTETGFQDNNSAKSFGGRVGFTPFQGDQWLNFGIGGWSGPERDEDTRHNRWILDADVTWSPMARLLLTAELLYGGEAKVSFRRRGIPFAAPSVENRDVNWLALYALAHYDFTKWLGVTFRYGYFDDYEGWRTGVAQTLQSFTLTPIVHLSRLIPDLRPLGVAYARTRHPLDWVDVRLEYRLDQSNKSVFSNSKPGIPVTSADKTAQEVTLQFVVNY